MQGLMTRQSPHRPTFTSNFEKMITTEARHIYRLIFCISCGNACFCTSLNSSAKNDERSYLFSITVCASCERKDSRTLCTGISVVPSVVSELGIFCAFKSWVQQTRKDQTPIALSSTRIEDRQSIFGSLPSTSRVVSVTTRSYINGSWCIDILDHMTPDFLG